MESRVTSKGRDYVSTRCRLCYNEKCKRAVRSLVQRRRAKFIEMYGSACVCCGESTPLFLCLDHVDDDGAERRRDGTGARTNNYREYDRAVAEYQPDVYQLMCWNCNYAKAAGVTCPHQINEE